MARALIVGCGCRGRELADPMVRAGWQVRGTSRRADGIEAIAGAGLEPAVADPGRPGTILELCGDVAVVVWLLGSAIGDRDQLEAIHGPRLERLLEKLVESPVRGFAYETAGSVDADLLKAGTGIVEEAGERWRIPLALLPTPREQPGWAQSSADRIAGLLAR